MSVPVPHFIDLGEVEQAKELRVYLKSKGADIPEESREDFVTDLKELLENCGFAWQKGDGTESEIEAVLNSLISLLILVPLPQCEELVSTFSEKLSAPDETTKWNSIRLRVLNNLFNGFDEKAPHRFIVYCSMVKFAGVSNLMNEIATDLKQVKKLLATWEIPKTKIQDLLRSLHGGFLACDQRERATQVMIELLGTYTESTASQAREDAQKCVATSLADPTTFLLDHMLNLKPVQLLDGEKIHDLLMIFITGKLADYMKFYQSNKDFVESIGLNHEQNMKKMRVLTFMHLAEGSKDIDFATLQKEIEIDGDDVEHFVIEAVKTQTVKAKIDQKNQKVLISSAMHRTFTKNQWIELNSELEAWQNNLKKVSDGFKLILAGEGQ